MVAHARARKPDQFEQNSHCSGCNGDEVITVLELGNDRAINVQRWCWECWQVVVEAVNKPLKDQPHG